MKRTRIRLRSIALALLLGSQAGGVAWAGETVYTIVLKGHQFTPKELTIPARTRVKVVIENQDPTAEEFESYELNREKVVAGNSRITLFLGPLKSGTYAYFGEFHKAIAQGVIIVGE